MQSRLSSPQACMCPCGFSDTKMFHVPSVQVDQRGPSPGGVFYLTRYTICISNLSPIPFILPTISQITKLLELCTHILSIIQLNRDLEFCRARNTLRHV